jgi:hypothetical protein
MLMMLVEGVHERLQVFRQPGSIVHERLDELTMSRAKRAL